jgi:hypothetical protein
MTVAVSSTAVGSSGFRLRKIKDLSWRPFDISELFGGSRLFIFKPTFKFVILALETILALLMRPYHSSPSGAEAENEWGHTTIAVCLGGVYMDNSA